MPEFWKEATTYDAANAKLVPMQYAFHMAERNQVKEKMVGSF